MRNALAQDGNADLGLGGAGVHIRSLSRQADINPENDPLPSQSNHKVDARIKNHTRTTLGSLELEGSTLVPAFRDDTLSYTWTVSKDVASTTVTTETTVRGGGLGAVRTGAQPRG